MRDCHYSWLGVAPPARCYLPAHSGGPVNVCLLGIAARRDCPFHPVRSTFAGTPDRLVSVALILTSRWTAVSCYAALRSPDVPPVLCFHNCTSGSLANFTAAIIADTRACFSHAWSSFGCYRQSIPSALQRPAASTCSKSVCGDRSTPPASTSTPLSSPPCSSAKASYRMSSFFRDEAKYQPSHGQITSTGSLAWCNASASPTPGTAGRISTRSRSRTLKIEEAVTVPTTRVSETRFEQGFSLET